jgi:hypothetical protein
MRWAALALWLLFGQSSDPVLENVRKRVLEDTQRMKRFTCRQTVTRVDSGKILARTPACSEIIRNHDLRHSGSPLRAWDRLRLDVGIVDGREVFSWAGAPNFEDDSRKIVPYGAFGTGDFGPFLAGIFGGKATIQFLGEQRVAGRVIRQYSYTISQEKSQYKVRTPVSRTVIVAHSGLFRLDPQKNDLIQLSVRSQELPTELDNCQTITDIDYRRVRIGGADALIPRESKLTVLHTDGVESKNTTVYSDCREYVGESAIHFEEAAPGIGANGRANRTMKIPGGLLFRARLLTPVDSDTAAAGDEFAAVLTTNLADRDGHIYAPVGSKATGRLLQVGGSSAQVLIKARLETIDVNGRVPVISENRWRFTKKRVVLKNDVRDWITAEP